MASEARSGGVRRIPLQPRDGNAAASPSLGGTALAKSKAKAKARAAAASPPSVRSYAARADTESRAAAVVRDKEVSLAEELEKARERRGRLRAARQVTESVLAEADERRQIEGAMAGDARVGAQDGRAAPGRGGADAPHRDAGGLCSGGIIEIQGGEEEKTGDCVFRFSCPVTVASTLLEEEAGADSSDKELLATPTRETTANATTENSSA